MAESTREDWEGVIKNSHKQLDLMEKTKREMLVAGEVQKIILDYAEKKLEEFPEPEEEEDEEGEDSDAS